MFRILLVLAIFLLAFALPASAQVVTGTPPFGSFGGGPDVINLANLNAHITIPILHKPGRGTNFNYDLNYDSFVWYPLGASGSQTWQPVANWGWRGFGEAEVGYIERDVVSSTVCLAGSFQNLHQTGTNSTYRWSYHDFYGIVHSFGTTQEIDGTCGSQTNTSTTLKVTSTDGAGYSFEAIGGTEIYLYSPNGQAISAAINSQAIPAGVLTTDRNGNQISANGSGFTDTLGTTALTVSGSGTPASPVALTYAAPSGANASYTVKYTTYSIQTNFGCSGITDYGTNGTTTANLVSEIDLPDIAANPNDKYTFAYEPTPGHAGFVTSRLASVTLPTGGTISYTYTGGSSGHITCADGSAATLTRATPDTAGGSPWIYAHSESGTAWTTLITDPQGNQTNINFQGIYETQRLVYQGSTSGTLLRQWTTCYNGNTSNCNSTAVTLPITVRTVTDQYGASGLQCKHNYVYNTAGGLTEQDDYDYGSGAPGVLLRKTLVTFAALNNITAFRQQVTVQNGGGTNVAQTNYNYDEVTPTATSGIAQHVAVTGSRGNLTSIDYPVAGLVSHFTYYDTGSPNTSVDVNGATTTYNYSSNAADCQMAFPTSISEPLSMSRSMTWNCTGGVPLTSTDENSQTTTTTYNDPAFWRPASVSFPDGGLTSWTYNSQTSVATTTKMNSSQNIVGTQLLDGLGRSKQQQLNSDPEGVVYQDTTYDSLGRPATASNPYRSTGDPTYGITTTNYDALSRPTSVTLQDGSLSTASYVNNTVTSADPAAKKRATTYDSLGRLTQVTEDPGGLGYITTYSYDALGDLLTVTQNGRAQRTYAYDAMSRLTSETNPESGLVTYAYDANGDKGDLTSRGAPAPNQTGTNTVTTTYTYDILHRLTQKSYSDGTTPTAFFSWDGTGRWGVTQTNTNGRLGEEWTGTSCCASGGAEIFSYDPMGRTLYNNQYTVPMGNLALNYSYDLAGDMTTYTNGMGVSFTQSFDASARPIGLTSSWIDANHPATLVSTDPSVGYYPHGAVRKVTLGDNISQTTAFNKTLDPCRINVNYSGTTLSTCTDAIPSGNVQDFNYGFNSGSTNNGNVATWTGTGTQNFNRSYSYDSLNRLGSLSSPSDPNGCTGLSWTYDAWGNRTDQSVTGGTCPTFHQTISAQNRLASSPYAYDSAGNLAADGTHTYFYDAENRLIQVDGTFGTCSTATACYLYDALGHRTVKQTGSTSVSYVHDLAGNVIDDYCTNCSGGFTGWAKGYTYFNGALTSEYDGYTFFVHGDHLGSTRLLTVAGLDLVSNPGFESGQTGWTGWDSNVTLVTNSTQAHSGSNYVHLSVAANTGENVQAPDVAVQPGDQITFGGWAYLESGDGSGGPGWWIQIKDANHNAFNWVGAQPDPISTSSGWVFQTATYTVPASGVSFVNLYGQMFKPDVNSALRVDDGFLYNNRTSLQIAQNLDYLPFGERNSADSAVSSHEFTGDEQDPETALAHTLFRQYSSNLGRWMTPDPAGLAAVDPADPQSWNRYAYVRNRPLRYVDLLGLTCYAKTEDGDITDNVVDSQIDNADDCADGGDFGGYWVDNPYTAVIVNGDDPSGGAIFFGDAIDATLPEAGGGGGNSGGGTTIKSILRKIGNYIPVVCGGGGFAYGGGRVSGGVASVGLYRIESFDTRSGHSGGPFTDITIGEGIQGGYGYATYSGGESEHFLFGGVGGDVGIASAGVSLYGSHVSGDSILHNQIGINGDLGIPGVGAGIGLGINTDSLTSCIDHHFH